MPDNTVGTAPYTGITPAATNTKEQSQQVKNRMMATDAKGRGQETQKGQNGRAYKVRLLFSFVLINF